MIKVAKVLDTKHMKYNNNKIKETKLLAKTEVVGAGAGSDSA